MNLKSYFDTNKGTGIISTSDSEGNVNAAVYGRPHVMDDGSIAFIMRNRLTRKNLESNPKAAYLFIENVPVYKGKRLYLKKIREEQDNEKINAMKRRSSSKDESPDGEEKFLVYFSVEKELPLIGPGNDL